NYRLGENNGVSWWIQPQGQFIYQDVQLDKFTDLTGTKVESSGPNLQTRLGAKAYMVVPTDKAGANYRPYAALNWIHNTEDYGLTLDGNKQQIGGNENIGEVKLGVEGQFSKASHASFNVSYQMGNDDYRDVQGNLS
ncbi:MULTISPECIES: autotransporter outer membrane beta-barrel domain-containing protein, partial [unclassified Acinetobacter]